MAEASHFLMLNNLGKCKRYLSPFCVNGGPHLQPHEKRQLRSFPAIQCVPGPAECKEEGEEAADFYLIF